MKISFPWIAEVLKWYSLICSVPVASNWVQTTVLVDAQHVCVGQMGAGQCPKRLGAVRSTSFSLIRSMEPPGQSVQPGSCISPTPAIRASITPVDLLVPAMSWSQLAMCCFATVSSCVGETWPTTGPGAVASVLTGCVGRHADALPWASWSLVFVDDGSVDDGSSPSMGFLLPRFRLSSSAAQTTAAPGVPKQFTPAPPLSDWAKMVVCTFGGIFHHVQGGGDFAGGIFHCGTFRISNVCEISRSIFRPLCEINPVRNLATGAKFSHWGFAGFAGGMLCVSHCLLPPPPFPWASGFHLLLNPLSSLSHAPFCTLLCFQRMMNHALMCPKADKGASSGHLLAMLFVIGLGW